MPHLPKSARFTIGEKVECCLLDSAEKLFLASYSAQTGRLELIRTAGAKIDTVKFFLQIAWETRVLDNKQYITVSEKMDEIGRMIGGWVRQLAMKETSA